MHWMNVELISKFNLASADHILWVSITYRKMQDLLEKFAKMLTCITNSLFN